MTNSNKVDMSDLMNEVKGAKVLGPIYDNPKVKINFQLHKFFFVPGYDVVNSWWIKYKNFLKTYAQWCFLGYIVGLGDRHTNNILVTE